MAEPLENKANKGNDEDEMKQRLDTHIPFDALALIFDFDHDVCHRFLSKTCCRVWKLNNERRKNRRLTLVQPEMDQMNLRIYHQFDQATKILVCGDGIDMQPDILKQYPDILVVRESGCATLGLMQGKKVHFLVPAGRYNANDFLGYGFDETIVLEAIEGKEV